ncbi:MAG: cyclic nucleotide-binding domain-containing protein [Gammaproteobacteria bacterium]|nr:cyclic nucleotide-binding domain-containing protein [Gammaproteobacteria bacterium]MDH5651060.1 cyclic nucleotide-binding domain-containing protein [Gammaproteobacteria bacterium]
MQKPESPASPTTISSELTRFLFDYGRKQRFATGQYIIREGQQSRNVFVILEGEAEILKQDENGNEKTVARVSNGTILGEMGVFMEQARTTSVRVSRDLTALEFTAESFTSAVAKIPDLSLRLLKSLSTKLSSGNEFIVGLGYAQSMLACGAYILDQRPSQVEKEASISLSINQISSETGLDRQVVRTAFERFNRRGVLMGLSFSGSTISGTANFPKLMRLLKTVTYPGPGKLSQQPAAEGESAKPATAPVPPKPAENQS